MHTIPPATMEGCRGEPKAPTPIPVIEGKVPSALSGTWFIMASVGDLDHPTLTQPRATSVLNGDGFIYKVQFQAAGAVLSQSLVRNASYVADEVSHENNNPELQFADAGVARLQFPELGTRDQSNTAVFPIRTHPAAKPQLLVCYDVGRPHVVDPATGKVLGAIGSADDWARQLGGVFPMFLSGAHPAFDPTRHELFVVSAARSFRQMIERVLRIIQPAVDQVQATPLSALEQALAEEWAHAFSLKHLVKGASHYLSWIDDVPLIGAHDSRPLGSLAAGIDFVTGKVLDNAALDGKGWRWLEVVRAALRMFRTLLTWLPPKNASARLLVQRDSGLTPFDIEVDGETLEVRDSLHQINVTESYVIIADTCFKFEVDQIFPDTPKLKPSVRRDLRERLSRRQNKTLPLYFIKRSDLGAVSATVQAKRIDVPLAGVHWMVQYADKGGTEVRVLVAHGNATDVSEFIDNSDLSFDGSKPIDQHLSGFFGAPLDAGQMGYYRINPFTDEVVQALATQPPGKRLWGIGLGTGFTQPGLAASTIDQTWWYTLGLAPQTVTQLNYNLYDMANDQTDTGERVVSKADFRAALGAGGEPGLLFRTECQGDSIAVVDVWEADPGVAISSPQAVRGTDGSQWLLCVLFAPKPEVERRIAIFDAQSLKKGPVAILDAGVAQWPYTLHSCWLDSGLGTEEPHLWARPLTEDVEVPKSASPEVEALLKEVRKRLSAP